MRPDRDLEIARARLVRRLRDHGIRDERVLLAIASVPREAFVDPQWRERAWDDTALPLAHGQTISQPYVVAAMTEALELGGDERVLEIGTGCGYQAAVLSLCAREVFSIEIVEPLAREAARRLDALGFRNVRVVLGDGSLGLPRHAPFDAIVISAAPRAIPQVLWEQLRDGGRAVLPVGDDEQHLIALRKRGDRWVERPLFPVRFVPMIGSVLEE